MDDVSAHERHLVINGYQSCILDGVAKHTHQEVETVKCKRGDDPRISVHRMIADSDIKCDETKHTGGGEGGQSQRHKTMKSSSPPTE